MSTRNNTTISEPMTRRDFIAWGARFLLLGGLAVLVIRHGSARRKTQDVCTDPRGYCRTCAALDHCGHPTARSYKAATGRGEAGS